MKEYKEIREENDNFTEKYNLAKQRNPANAKNEINTVSAFQSTFVDLISRYNIKGIKVPDLSIKNNLFQPSPILMDNDRIVDYYRLGDNQKTYTKDLNFLLKLNTSVNEKMLKDEKKLKFFNNNIMPSNKKIDPKKDILPVKIQVIEKTNKEHRQEIKLHSKSIFKSKSMIDTGEFLQLFELKGIYTGFNR